MSIQNNEIWQNFIEEFKHFPELWDVRSDKYKNKLIKNKAYISLLETFKEIEKTATVDSMKKRINDIRTSYRRELKKKMNSEKSGASAEELYEPTLWYYNSLNFLKDVETPMNGILSMNSSDEENSITVEPIQRPKRNRQNGNQEDRNVFLRTAAAHLEGLSKKNQRDDSDIFAEGWACSFRKLSPQQQLYAKKTIDEILVLGQMNKLTFNNVVPTFSQRPTPLHLFRASTPIITAPVYQTESNSANSYESTGEYTSIDELLADSKFS